MGGVIRWDQAPDVGEERVNWRVQQIHGVQPDRKDGCHSAKAHHPHQALKSICMHLAHLKDGGLRGEGGHRRMHGALQ